MEVNDEENKMIEDKKDKKKELILWRSCSGCLLDPRVLVFFSSLSISLGVLIFSGYKIATVEGCQQNNMYLGLLTFVLGIWLPNPVP